MLRLMSKEHAGGTPHQAIQISHWGEEAFTVEAIQDFDWAGVEDSLLKSGSAEGIKALDPEAKRVLDKMVFAGVNRYMTELFNWIHAGGSAQPQGVMIRSYVVAWAFVRKYRNCSQSELAAVMDLKNKQSVGREVSAFRDRFKFLNEYMQTESARAKCREREERKKRIAERAESCGASAEAEEDFA